jgi:uncharacterized protein YcbX
MSTARVRELWRFPVKSLQGERLDRADLVEDGLRGDREWGIRDEATGYILTGRREPRLLLASARLEAEGSPVVVLPDGSELSADDPAIDKALSSWLGREVRLVKGSSADQGVLEYFADNTDDTSEAAEYVMPPGRFVDARPVLVLTTASLAQCASLYPDGEWDARRLRPNILVETDDVGWVEDDWVKQPLRMGEVELAADGLCVRCTMTTRPQPGLRADLDIYRTLARQHRGRLGVYAFVRRPGTISAGDTVERI